MAKKNYEKPYRNKLPDPKIKHQAQIIGDIIFSLLLKLFEDALNAYIFANAQILLLMLHFSSRFMSFQFINNKNGA